MPSKSVEEYLEALYKLSAEREPVTTGKLSEYLGIAAGSVTEMLKKLSRLGYIDYSPYRGSILTDKGRELGEKVTRKHRLLEVFLNKILRIKDELIHRDACEMEHSLSDDAEVSLCRFLSHPDRCPDGEVIPACNLNFPSCEDCLRHNKEGWAKAGKRRKNLVSINSLREGDKGIVAFIRGEHKFLRRLLDMGLTPGARIRVLRVAPLKGPVEIAVRGSRLAIGQDIAANVFIELNKKV
jgi:DtxR family Mn-dependent transcriptional regulator